MPSELYPALAAKFDTHHQLAKGGAKLDYITGEQCITRLNETLGVDGWGFEVLEHGQLGEDFWARGRLTAYFPERTVVREQFGGVTANRGMAPADTLKGAATDALKKCASLIGVALYLSDKDDPASHQPAPRESPKCDYCGRREVGANLNSKTRKWRCADEAGCQRYMDAKDQATLARQAPASIPAGYREPSDDEWTVFDDKVREQTGYSRGDVCALLGRDPADHLRALNLSGTPKTGKALIADLIAYKREGRAIPGVVTQPAVIEGEASEAVKHLQSDLQSATPPAPEAYGCQVCGNELEETRFRDGTSWLPAKLAEFGRKKHDMVLCMACYKQMNAAKAGKLGVDPVMA